MKIKKTIYVLLACGMIFGSVQSTSAAVNAPSAGGGYPVDVVTSDIDIKNYTSDRITGRGFSDSLNTTGRPNQIRLDAIKEASAGLGARLALKKRITEINNELAIHGPEMDKIFNFGSVIIDGDVLPPVITEANNNFNQSGLDEVRVSDKIYKIERDARFVSVTPTWRDYFKSDAAATEVEMPHMSMTPKSAEEKKVWDMWLLNGWNEGSEQANNMFKEGMSLLRRDYNGMLRYKSLYKQNVVSKPYIARTSMGVTGGGKQLNINDKVYRITDHSALNTEKDKWMYELPKSK